MGAIDPILEELARETDTTRRVLERIPTERLSWKPHEKSKSLGELAWHIATLPPRAAIMAQGEEGDPTAVRPAPRPATTAELLEGLERGFLEARAGLEKLDDEALARRFVMRIQERKLFAGPKITFLRTVMLNHLYHHRGQLSVYLRLLGIAVPPIYGPTADEK